MSGNEGYVPERKRNHDEVSNSDQSPTKEGEETVMSFQLLRTYFDKKFQEQGTKLEQKIEADSTIMAKKLKIATDGQQRFNYKGNRIQFESNVKVLHDLEEVLDLVVGGSKSRAAKRIASVIKDVKKSNTLIRLADKSPAGWGTVEECLSDTLATDSDDDKKMKAAEKRAIKKSQRGKNLRFDRPAIASYRASSSASATRPSQFPPKPLLPSTVLPDQTRWRPFPQQEDQRYGDRARRSTCYRCGKRGHWRRDCTTE